MTHGEVGALRRSVVREARRTRVQTALLAIIMSALLVLITKSLGLLLFVVLALALGGVLFDRRIGFAKGLRLPSEDVPFRWRLIMVLPIALAIYLVIAGTAYLSGAGGRVVIGVVLVPILYGYLRLDELISEHVLVPSSSTENDDHLDERLHATATALSAVEAMSDDTLARFVPDQDERLQSLEVLRERQLVQTNGDGWWTMDVHQRRAVRQQLP